MSLPQSTTNDYVIDDRALGAVAGSPLFYPSSGRDVTMPTKIFGTTCQDLHFADIGYFSDQASRWGGQDPTTEIDAQLRGTTERLVNIPPSDWVSDPKYAGIQPRIRSQNFVDNASGANFRIHLHRRRGPTAMRKELDKIGVFFYRRDSDEGGSGTKWLTIDKWPKTKRRRWLVFEVLDKLMDGGLIVTDGSMCKGSRNPYRYFRELVPRGATSAAAVKDLIPPFSDGLGRSFSCVGAICDQLGRALIWQVNRT